MTARLRILAREMQPGKMVQANKLAAVLEVSTKTIYRDLMMARNQLGWPLESFCGQGWMLTAPLTLCDGCQKKVNQ